MFTCKLARKALSFMLTCIIVLSFAVIAPPTANAATTKNYGQERQSLLEIVQQYGFSAEGWVKGSDNVYNLRATYKDTRVVIEISMNDIGLWIDGYIAIEYYDGVRSSSDVYTSCDKALDSLKNIMEQPIATYLLFDWVDISTTYDGILRSYAESLGYHCTYSTATDTVNGGISYYMYFTKDQVRVTVTPLPASYHYNVRVGEPDDSTGTSRIKSGTPINSYGTVEQVKSVLQASLPSPAQDKPSSWATEQVNAAIAANLVPQSLQSKYTQATTRAEFCALAVALYESIKGEITDRKTFTDTNDINVQKMAAAGVVNGVGDNRFDPNASLTREQAAVMLANLANALGKPLPKQASTSTDKTAFSSWAAEAIGQVQAACVMSGTGNDMFSPKGAYTREQSIVTVLRMRDTVAAMESKPPTPGSRSIRDSLVATADEFGFTIISEGKITSIKDGHDALVVAGIHQPSDFPNSYTNNINDWTKGANAFISFEGKTSTGLRAAITFVYNSSGDNEHAFYHYSRHENLNGGHFLSEGFVGPGLTSTGFMQDVTPRNQFEFLTR